MSKPKAQGTVWESLLVRKAQDAGLRSSRLPEGGSWDAGDVWINDLPGGGEDIAIVAWSRLVKNGDGRRTADGARSVVVMSTDSFLRLAALVADRDIGFVVECKASERLNVTRELAAAERKLAHWKSR